MVTAALAARTLQTLRGRFESLRGGGPYPAIMAEVPAGLDPGFRTFGRVPVPPIRRYSARPDVRYLGSSAVLSPASSGNPRSAPERHIWLACGVRILEKLRGAFEGGAGIAPSIRSLASLDLRSGATTTLEEWLWTLFEVAEKRLPFSPLGLRGGHVTVASRAMHIPEHQVEAVRINPDRQDLFAKLVRSVDLNPTRYWVVDDVVEASLLLLDLTATDPLEPPGSNGHSVSVAPRSTNRAKRPRGKTASQLLQEWWADPKRRQQLLNAGSSDAIGRLIGKSGSAVREAGPIWDDTIKPPLKGTRVVSRMVREQDRLDA